MLQLESISPQQLAARAGPNVDLIDVRTPVEYHELHATSARNVPLDALDVQAVMKARNGTADEPLYVICRTDGRGAKACQKFIDAGFTNVVNVEGGTDAWAAAGLPVIRGQKAISLERQVRILAGLIVLISALLAIFVHPYFAGVSAFIGAGLMFAGITDSCGMGMMLAKMPWNQVQNGAKCCSAS